MNRQVSNQRLWLAGRLGLTGFFFVLLTTVGLAQGPVGEPDNRRRCGTVEREAMLQRMNPLRRQQLEQLNEQLRDDTGLRKLLRLGTDETVFRIPVVVHVIHNTPGNLIGGSNNPNISDEQIASQIQVLNEDYRRQAGTRGFNTNPVGADTGIEFFLAKTDPQGAVTNGITRHYYPDQTAFDPYDLADANRLSQLAYWPSDRYLNIWVAPLSGRYLGYAQFPTAADTLRGLEGVTNERTDGVIIDYRYFGRQIGTVRSPTYCCGRTTTHEVGHWLGLIHTWGDAVCGDDYVYDTPTIEAANETGQCTALFSTCSGVRVRNQIENYMDYSPDFCMNLFTRGQRERMRAVLQLSPRRARLIRSVEALPPADVLTVGVIPNPVRTEATVEVQFSGFRPLQVDVFDALGRSVRTLTYPDTPSIRLTLTVDDLPAGIYVLRVRAGDETQGKRILIK